MSAIRGIYRRRLRVLVVSLLAVCALGGTAVAQAATVLTVSGNTTLAPQPMETELRGVMCQPPNVCKKVEYASGGSGEQVYTSGYTALKQALSETSGDVVIMAYSQGAVIGTRWLINDASTAPQSPDLLYVVLLGNQSQSLNGWSTISGGVKTPNDGKYKVVDVCKQYDPLCDYPNVAGLPAIMNALAGYTQLHGNYTNVDVNDPNNWVRTVGNTTYVLVPTEQLPMFSWMRRIGLSAVADQLDAQWKPVIESSYERAGYTRLGDQSVLPLNSGHNGDSSATSASKSTPGTNTLATTRSAGADVTRASVSIPTTTPSAEMPVEPTSTTPSTMRKPIASGDSSFAREAPTVPAGEPEGTREPEPAEGKLTASGDTSETPTVAQSNSVDHARATHCCEESAP